MNKHPIEQIHSSIYDKVVKSITLLFIIITLLISIGLDIVQGLIDFNSNQSDYDAQNVTVGYISDNLIYKPIKDAYFRDLDCDTSEEIQQLFPFGEQNITRWYSQLICVTRFQDIRLSTSCSDTEYNCGPYCISTSEGSQCPISKMTIIENEIVDEDADQNLENKRDLYIQRDNSSYGIFQIQVVIRGYPCLNPSIYMTAGLINATDYTDPENCDGSDYDTDNSVKIEQTTLSTFAKQGLESLGFNGVPSTVTDGAITYLTARNKISSNADERCTIIDKQMIYDTENCASSIEEIGFIYLVIKEIFTSLIGIILILEIIILKCRIVNDIRIVTVILKIFLICQMSFILIQGGLILYQEQLRREAQQYFWSIANCYQSEQIQNVFINFPNLFSSDVNIYVAMNRIALIIIGISEFILLMMYIVQMFHWCFKQKKEKKYQQKQQQLELVDSQRQRIPSREIDAHNSDTDHIQKIQSQIQTINQPMPIGYQPSAQAFYGQNQFDQNQSNSIPQQNGIIIQQQPKLTDSYIPPQSSSVAQVVLGKKNSKY